MKKTIVKVTIDGIEDTGKISDGYHTFDELYEHRAVLWIAYCKFSIGCSDRNVWRSKLHSDGTMFDGMFILGITLDDGRQMTYHLEMEKWNECSFVKEVKKSPEFDGHTSDDVLERLKQL